MERPDPAERPVLVLDFGSQYVQLIARRVRERHAFARIVRHDVTAERVRELNPLALILSGGPSSVYEAGAPGATRACSTSASRSSASATACNWPARRSGGRSSPALLGSTAGPTCGCSTPDEPLFHDVPHHTTVWMSHGDQVQIGGRGFRPPGRDRDLPGRRRQAPRAAGLRPPVPPRGRPHAVRRPDPGQLPRPDLPEPALLDDGHVHRALGRRDPAAGRRRPTGSSAGCRAGSIRRSPRRLLAKALGPRVVCIFVDNGLLRAGEREAVAEAFGQHSSADLRVVDASRAVPERLAGRDRPAGEAGPDRPHVHRRLPRRGEVDPGRAVPGAGDALPRRDRERRRRRRPGRDDQAPPQRRRPAGRARVRADRALARPVQGRGPPPRPGAGPARQPGLAAPVPRPRPGGALPGRGDRRAAGGRSARPTPSSSKSCATPGSNGRSPRRSPCSCRCSRSA